MSEFKIIGITGGIGAGKSLVVNKVAEQFSCGKFVTDLMAYGIMREEGCKKEIEEAFAGYDIKECDGNFSSVKIGRVIFNHDNMRRVMNAIVHPKVIAAVVDGCQKAQEEGKEFALVESALLFESGLSEKCNETWNITADLDVRIKRLHYGRKYPIKKAKSIISGQLSDEKFQELADYSFLNNNGPDAIVEICRMLESYGYQRVGSI